MGWVSYQNCVITMSSYVQSVGYKIITKFKVEIFYYEFIYPIWFTSCYFIFNIDMHPQAHWEPNIWHFLTSLRNKNESKQGNSLQYERGILLWSSSAWVLHWVCSKRVALLQVFLRPVDADKSFTFSFGTPWCCVWRYDKLGSH